MPPEGQSPVCLLPTLIPFSVENELARPPVLGWAQTARGRTLEALCWCEDLSLKISPNQYYTGS